MTETFTLGMALDIAIEAHEGQTRVRKDGVVEPYVNHPIRVMARCSTPIVRIAALLHDVLEDTHFTADDLRSRGVPERAVHLVEVVTRGDETYDEMISRIIADGAEAIELKLGDNGDNLDDLHGEFERLRPRYEKARQRLLDAQVARRVIALEARCEKCGEHFNPLDENDLEHISTVDGSECGGQGAMVGAWG